MARFVARRIRPLPQTAVRSEFHQHADEAAPAFERATLTAMRELRVDRAGLQHALEMQSIAGALSAIDHSTFAVALRGAMERPVVHLIGRSARRAVDTIPGAIAKAVYPQPSPPPQQVGVSGVFDITNPWVVAAAQSATGQMVRDVDASTQDAISRVIHQAVVQGLHPYQAARLIESVIGLAPAQAMAVANYLQGLLDDGVSPGRAQRLADQYAERLLRERAVGIARTETIRAEVLGTQAGWNSAIAGGLLDSTLYGQQWIVTPDDRMCPDCADLEDEIVPFDGTFSAGVGGPPLHPFCRCSIGVALLPTQPRPVVLAGGAPNQEEL